jgi:hypothetical protein
LKKEIAAVKRRTQLDISDEELLIERFINGRTLEAIAEKLGAGYGIICNKLEEIENDKPELYKKYFNAGNNSQQYKAILEARELAKKFLNANITVGEFEKAHGIAQTLFSRIMKPLKDSEDKNDNNLYNEVQKYKGVVFGEVKKRNIETKKIEKAKEVAYSFLRQDKPSKEFAKDIGISTSAFNDYMRIVKEKDEDLFNEVLHHKKQIKNESEIKKSMPSNEEEKEIIDKLNSLPNNYSKSSRVHDIKANLFADLYLLDEFNLNKVCKKTLNKKNIVVNYLTETLLKTDYNKHLLVKAKLENDDGYINFVSKVKKSNAEKEPDGGIEP